MKISFIDHIFIIVKNITATEKFYSSFLGKPVHLDERMAIYETGDTKVFFVLPKESYERLDKDKGGLNHIAFGVHTPEELKSFETMLNDAGVKHSGIKIDKHGGKDYIWFDDPDGGRVEIYCRPIEMNKSSLVCEGSGE